MKTGKNIFILLAPVLMLALSCQTTETITFESLLEEMADRERLASYPHPAYLTKQFSSYDRASVSPDEPGWFANWDRSMFIREENIDGRHEYVMVDAEGPGAIVRWWMTFAGEGAGEGIIRIYLDKEETPAVEGVALDILSRGQLVRRGPFSCPVAPETDMSMKGHNLYLPIPYNSHVKITYESEHIVDAGAKSGGEAVYYNINYRTYTDRVNVETFSMDVLENSRDKIEEISSILEKDQLDTDLASVTDDIVSFDHMLSPDEEFKLEIDGPAAIREIVIKLNADNLEQALRSTVIEMEFDGNRTFWVPAGDFFGTGYKIRKVDTWYSTVCEDGIMRAWWVMPFADQAIITLHNLDKQDVQIVKGKISTSPWDWDDRSMHFGGTWLQYTNLYTGEFKSMDGEQGNPFDINYTHLKGEGVVVGDVLTLFNTTYAWWGEGDEKIYVDGEDFPSHFGTGTEDYYGYAWCRPEVFNEPFIAQPDGSGNFWPGYTVNLRYRALDAIPFTSELIFDMEMWHWVSTWINFAPATFFYLKPGGEILLEPDIEGATEKIALKREDIISPWIKNNTIEGENLIEMEREGGRISFQWGDQHGWSEDQHLLWRDVDQGDALHLAFKSDFEGYKEVVGIFTSSPDYGTVSISINNSTPVIFNGYNPEEIILKEFSLGRHKISKGMNYIKISMLNTAPGKEHGSFSLDVLSFN